MINDSFLFAFSDSEFLILRYSASFFNVTANIPLSWPNACDSRNRNLMGQRIRTSQTCRPVCVTRDADIFWKRKTNEITNKMSLAVGFPFVLWLASFFLGGRSHLSDPKFRKNGREGTALGQVLLFFSFLLFFFFLLDILVGARGGKKPLPVVPSGHGQVFLISDETTTRRPCRGRIFLFFLLLGKHFYAIKFLLNSVKFTTLFSHIDLKWKG